MQMLFYPMSNWKMAYLHSVETRRSLKKRENKIKKRWFQTLITSVPTSSMST